MNLKSIVASVLLAAVTLMGFQLIQSHPISNTLNAQEQQNEDLVGFEPIAWEYARLVKTFDENTNSQASSVAKYTFTFGDQIIGQNNPLPLNLLSRRLSIDKVNQITIDTVLNQLGRERWELIQVNNASSSTTWLFKRVR